MVAELERLRSRSPAQQKSGSRGKAISSRKSRSWRRSTRGPGRDRATRPAAVTDQMAPGRPGALDREGVRSSLHGAAGSKSHGDPGPDAYNRATALVVITKMRDSDHPPRMRVDRDPARAGCQLGSGMTL